MRNSEEGLLGGETSRREILGVNRPVGVLTILLRLPEPTLADHRERRSLKLMMRAAPTSSSEKATHFSAR